VVGSDEEAEEEALVDDLVREVLVEEVLVNEEVLESGNNIFYFYILFFLIPYYEKSMNYFIMSFGIFRTYFFLKI